MERRARAGVARNVGQGAARMLLDRRLQRRGAVLARAVLMSRLESHRDASGLACAGQRGRGPRVCQSTVSRLPEDRGITWWWIVGDSRHGNASRFPASPADSCCRHV